MGATEPDPADAAVTSASDDPADPAPSPAADECLDCGADLDAAAYCAVCGQRRVTGPLRTVEVLRDLWQTAIDVDRGFLHTLIGMTIAPGRTVRAYVDGKRRTYTPPFRYYLILAAVWLAFPTLIGFDYAAYTERALAPTREQLARLSIESQALLDWFERTTATAYEVRRWTSLVNLPLFAVGGLLVFRSAKRTFAEWFAFSLYVSGHSLIVGMLTFVLFHLELDVTAMVLANGALAYVLWAYHGFSGESIGAVLAKGLLVVVVGGTLVACGTTLLAALVSL